MFNLPRKREQDSVQPPLTLFRTSRDLKDAINVVKGNPTVHFHILRKYLNYFYNYSDI